MSSLVEQVNDTWTSKFLNMLPLINTPALRRAILNVKEGQDFERNFILFHYKSGLENGVYLEECIPGKNVSISHYVNSDAFYKALIGNGIPGLKFRIWSRSANLNHKPSERQLMLMIKKNFPKVVRQPYMDPSDFDQYADMPPLVAILEPGDGRF